MSSSDTSEPKANSILGPPCAAGNGTTVIARTSGDRQDLPQCPFDRVCGNCGYLLTGLQEGGLCPECGSACPDDEIVLPGWGAGPYENLATFAPSRIWRVGLPALLWLAFFWLPVLCGLFHHRLASAAAWLAIFTGIAALFLYRRWRLVTDFGCTAHLRLSPRGIGQRQGFGPVKLTPWASNLKVKVSPRPQGSHRLGAWRVHRKRRPDPNPNNWIVAFELKCSTEQAEYLRALILKWGRDA